MVVAFRFLCGLGISKQRKGAQCSSGIIKDSRKQRVEKGAKGKMEAGERIVQYSFCCNFAIYTPQPRPYPVHSHRKLLPLLSALLQRSSRLSRLTPSLTRSHSINNKIPRWLCFCVLFRPSPFLAPILC